MALVVVEKQKEEQEQMLEPEEPRHDKRLEHCDCRLDWKVEQRQRQLLGDYFRDRYYSLNSSWASWHHYYLS